MASVLLDLAAAQGQTILVRSGTDVPASTAVVAVGGTELRAEVEEVWNDAAGVTEPGATVAALASPIQPGYAFVLQGATRCRAGGTGLAAAVWGGVASLVTSAPFSKLLDDAGRRQAGGEIVAFRDVTVGQIPRDDLFGPGPDVAGPGFDTASGWGAPDVAGLVAAAQCFGVDCDDRDPCTSDACTAGGVCRHGPAPDGTACEDFDACSLGDACRAGVCVPGPPADCRDVGQCTVDGCDPHLGCVHLPNEEAGNCQVLHSRSRRRHCALDWVVEGAPATDGRHRLVCRDGDPDCDQDVVPGQCTFHVNVCALRPEKCNVRRVRVEQPTLAEARRSSVLNAVRTRLQRSVRPPLAGRCTSANDLVVPADTDPVRLRLRDAGRSARTLRLTCRPAS